MTIISFDAARVERYLDQAIDQYFRDPPDSDYQRGFLAALCVIKREALGRSNDKIDAAEKMCGGKSDG